MDIGFILPDPIVDGIGSFTAPSLSENAKAIIAKRGQEFEGSDNPDLRQAGCDICRLLAEIDRLNGG